MPTTALPSAATAANGATEASTPPAALSHLKVLDLSRVLAGPWASQMLGDEMAEWRRIGNQVQLIALTTKFRSSQPDSKLAIEQAFSPSLIAGVPVASADHPDRKSVLVDASGLLLGRERGSRQKGLGARRGHEHGAAGRLRAQEAHRDLLQHLSSIHRAASCSHPQARRPRPAEGGDVGDVGRVPHPRRREQNQPGSRRHDQ